MILNRMRCLPTLSFRRKPESILLLQERQGGYGFRVPVPVEPMNGPGMTSGKLCHD